VTTATAEHISNHLKELLEGVEVEALAAIVASMRARDHVPDSLAAELANELAAILSEPPMETEFGPIYNRPTISWYRRKTRRMAEAKS
jgi:hypothetical protein